MFRKILFVTGNLQFGRSVGKCLVQEHNYEVFIQQGPITPNVCKVITDKKIDVVVYDLLLRRNNAINELELLVKQGLSKLIVLENGLDLYFNNQSHLPFSVYSKFEPVTSRSRYLLKCENLINELSSNYIIFRVSELYGPNIHYGLIYDFLTREIVEIPKGERDFLYEGDLVFAIEVALETNAAGVFDIASGKSVDTSRLIEIAKRFRKNGMLNIKVNRKEEVIRFDCSNFQFYKWTPLIEFKTGLTTTRKLLGG